MKRIALAVIVCGSAAAQLFAGDTNVLNNEQARVSYAIGMLIGHNWKQQGVDVNLDLFARGVKDSQSGGPTLLTPQEMRETLTAYQRTLIAKQQKLRAEQAVTNEAEGQAFLAKNKNSPGIHVFPDGLQYKILSEGDGPIPGLDDTVVVNYRGTFIDGKEFDSSAKRGHPAEFPVKGVIHAWTEALTHMKVGAKWRLFVPPDLGYGERGGPGIPPGSTLVFDVQLVSIAPKTPPAASPKGPTTSDIIKVPSAEEMKKGAKIQVLTPKEVKKMQEEQSSSQSGK